MDMKADMVFDSANRSTHAALISRDEMNLAEFPLAVLSTRSDPRTKTLEFEDTIKGRNGELIHRRWVITGADKFGLPTASDDEVLLGLMKLTVDNGFTAKKVFFTRYELLKILNWSTEGRSYCRLQNAFDRLSGVRIKAANAFFDNETKSHSTKNFGIIDAYEINDGRDIGTKPSFFIWSDELFNSFKAGFIKKLDLEFVLQLKSAVSKRVYRYLDKHFWYKSRIQINLFTLAHEKIGISRNYKYASSLKQQLEPALRELHELGFLGRWEYAGRGPKTEAILFAGRAKPRSVAARETEAERGEEQEEPALSLEKNDCRSLIEKLTGRGLREMQAERLVRGRTDCELHRMGLIIDYFDSLVRTNSRLISRSPVGFLYRAVERPDRFVLPEESQGLKKCDSRVASVPGGESRSTARASEDECHKEYLRARRAEIARLRANVEPEVCRKIRIEVEAGLSKVRNLISKTRFEETVEHGVEERLASLFAFPDYEEWRRSRRR
jgi:hypothetical protein